MELMAQIKSALVHHLGRNTEKHVNTEKEMC